VGISSAAIPLAPAPILYQVGKKIVVIKVTAIRETLYLSRDGLTFDYSKAAVIVHSGVKSRKLKK
jgi:hypothetical protein